MALQEFIAKVKQSGLARTNRFTIDFTPPPIISYTKAQENLRKIMLFCDTAQLPGINLSTTQSRSYGEFREMPYERLFDPVTLSFYVDSELIVKELFDDWINSVQNTYSRDFAYYDEYTTDMRILLVDIENSGVYECELFEAYPKTVSPVSLDYASREIMKINVTMQYRYWRKRLLGKYNFGPGKQFDKNKLINSESVEDLRNNIDSFIRDKAIPQNYFSNFNVFQGMYNNFGNLVENDVIQTGNRFVDNGINSVLTVG